MKSASISEMLPAPPNSISQLDRSNNPGQRKEEFQAYYDHSRKIYWIENERRGWIEINEQSLRPFLKASGLSVNPVNGEFVSALDKRIMDIQYKKDVAYAGPLAGAITGIKEICGNLILVTTSPKLIEPKIGDCPLIEAVLDNLFNLPNCDQRPYVLGWLKISFTSLRNGRLKPGQALAIAGPGGAGKSRFQKIVTEILGGRAAKPYRYMSGATTFNADLLGAEHLMIEDDVPSSDIGNRRKFGASIKDTTVNEIVSCHQTSRQAISLKPFWRLTISLNDEPENLMILPPIDDSLQDKIILLKAGVKPMPMPTATTEQRDKFWNALYAELPAFLWHLETFIIPDKLKSERFGITHFHHPELLDAIDALAPETRLLSIIDAEYFGSGKKTDAWKVTASKLEQTLLNSGSKCEVSRLVRYGSATGTYLGRLAKKFPHRVHHDRSAKQRNWIIHPPPPNE